MIELHIKFASGKVKKLKLSKTRPVSIGRHQSNDIRIDEKNVPPMLCRISWAKTGFEIAAANLDGVEINGTLVRKTMLSDGDVLRIGSIDITFRSPSDSKAAPTPHKKTRRAEGKARRPVAPDKSTGGEESKPPTQSAADDVQLKPIDEDEPLPSLFDDEEDDSDGGTYELADRNASVKDEDDVGGVYRVRAGEIVDEEDELDELEFADSGELDELEFSDASEDKNHSVPDAADGAGSETDDVPSDRPMLSRSTRFSQPERKKTPPARESSPAPPAAATAEPPSSSTGTVPRRAGKNWLPWRTEPVRPGQQDVIRSPFVLTLGGGALILLLIAATFWFIIGRDTVQRQYDAALEEIAGGRYSRGITLLEDFIVKYPRHKYTDSARIAVGRARIEKEISGATPSWSKGLKQLEEFVRARRDTPDFAEQHGKISEYAGTIALGAAKSAGTLKNPDLLDVSEIATNILSRYSSSDAPPTELLKQILKTRESSEAIILKQNTIDEATAKVKKAIQGKKPLAALEARRQLLDRYPDLHRNKEIAGLLEQALQTARDMIVVQETNRAAITDDYSNPTKTAFTPTPHTRSRQDAVSDGRIVCAVAKQCCFGVDAITGDPVWRRVIGLDTPFFPIDVATSTPGLLLFDTNHDELNLVDRKTGSLLWRQPIQADVSGVPLVSDGQVYLPTLGGNLFKIDVETGLLSVQITFPQQVLAPPVLLSGGKYLAVAGADALVYTLTTRPFQCIAANYFAHRAGAVKAPLLAMGGLILLCDNDRIDSCRLRVIDARKPESLAELPVNVRVDGHVVDKPILRGNQLFVPSTGERINAFTVSDDPNQPTMTQVAHYESEAPKNVPVYLVAGPDGQLWAVGDTMQKFQLTADTIRLEPSQVAPGITAQPPKSMGERIYLGRHTTGTAATILTQTDRQAMTTEWRIVLGAAVLARLPSRAESTLCITEAGDMCMLKPSDLKSGGFSQNTKPLLRSSEVLDAPLRVNTLPNDKAVVHCGGKKPRLWLVNSSGEIEQRMDLDAPLQANPTLVAGQLVLPLPGRLKVVGGGSSAAGVVDYLMPVGSGEAKEWRWLVPLDDNQFLAADSAGKLSRLQYRTEPKPPHLFEVASIDLDQPADVQFAASSGQVYVADASGKLSVLDARDLRTLSDVSLDAPATDRLWLVNAKLYVAVGREKLVCFDPTKPKAALWSCPIDGQGLAGPPLPDGENVIAAQRNGTVLIVDATTGNVARQIPLGQPLALGPFRVGALTVVSTLDGSFLDITSTVRGEP